MIRTPVLLLAIAAPALAQGKLDQVRDAIDSPRSSDDKSRGDTRSDSSADVNWSYDPQPTVGGRGNSSGGEPWDPERLFTGDGRFAAHPYAVAGTPYMWLNDTNGGWFSAQASAEVGSDFDGLTRTGFRLFLDTEFRL